MKDIHHGDGEEQGQGYHGGYQQACPEVPQQEEHYEHDDEEPEDQVLDHGQGGLADQFAAVQKSIDINPFGQGLLHLRHPFLNGVDHLFRVGMFEHHHLSQNLLSLAIAGDGPETYGMAIAYLAYIPHQYRYTVVIFDHDPLNIGKGTCQSVPSDKITFIVFFDIGAAGGAVVFLQGREHLQRRHVQCPQLFRVQRHLILLQKASPGIHLHHAGDAGELALDDPVLDGAQVHRRINRIITGFGIQDVLVDLTQSRGDGAHLGRAKAFGDLFLCRPYLLGDELAGKEHPHPLLKDDRHHRQAELGD